MKKLKLIILLCLTACIAVAACLFSACTNENNEPVSAITVTVKLPDGSPAVGADVGICSVKGDKGGMCLNVVTVDKTTGSVTVELPESFIEEADKYEIHITAPAGYIYADESGNAYESLTGMRIPKTQGSVVITLKAA